MRSPTHAGSRRFAIAILATSAIIACSKPASRSDESSSRAATPSRGSTPAGYTLHEWGVIGIVTGVERGVGGTSSQRPAPPEERSVEGNSYKPVIYVHLDPGVDEQRFSLEVGLGPTGTFVEHWPPATVSGPSLRFDGIRVERGGCAIERMAPAGFSPECATSDDFCEAAEIPRYRADRDTCLTRGDLLSSLLFYRAAGLDVSGAPIAMEVPAPDGPPTLVRREGPAPFGSVFRIVRGGGAVAIDRIDSANAVGELGALPGVTLTPDATRDVLVREARVRGLTEAEADAFVDAWASAYFATSARQGPVAAGRPPAGLAEADRSVLYFAPQEWVDRVIPLRATPPARQTRRVFLVRLVDGRTVHAPPPPTTIARITMVRPAGQAVVHGGLTSDQVRRVMLRNLPQFQHCYEIGLETHPRLAGRVTLQFIVSPSGTVSTASAASSTLNASSVEACFDAAARRMTFPQPEPRGLASVQYPLIVGNASEP